LARKRYDTSHKNATEAALPSRFPFSASAVVAAHGFQPVIGDRRTASRRRLRILGCLARGYGWIRTILSRDVGLGHDVLLHLLQDNILQRVKFQAWRQLPPSGWMGRDVLQQ
jgi:hypothetical protein